MGIFDRARKDLVREIKRDVERDLDCTPRTSHEMEDGGVEVPASKRNLDAHRELEAMIKRHLGAEHVVFSAQMLDGTVLTYVPEEIGDKDLVYLTRTLLDIRNERLNE